MSHFKKLLFCTGGNLVGVEPVYMQYDISDSQALLCFLLILRMVSLNTLFLCSVGQQAWLCSYLVFKLYAKIKAFLLIKKLYSTFPSILP